MVEDHEEVGKMDASEIHRRRVNAIEVLTPHRRDEFTFPNSRWNSKIVGMKSRIAGTHSEAA